MCLLFLSRMFFYITSLTCCTHLFTLLSQSDAGCLLTDGTPLVLPFLRGTNSFLSVKPGPRGLGGWKGVGSRGHHPQSFSR